jgi:hypothetical protein
VAKHLQVVNITRMRVYLTIFSAVILGLISPLFGADLAVPKSTVANTAINIATKGDGSGTLYLFGPVTRLKRDVRVGESITLNPEDVRVAGLYTAMLRASDGSTSRTFFVAPASPANVNFLAQPSRVSAGAKDVISGTAFVMDSSLNLVLESTPVRFELAVEGAPALARTATTRDGVAWTRIDSSRRAGNAQFTASVGNTSVRRVIQQVAAEPCNLRIHAQSTKGGIVVETDPVRDCGGNPVPDGTIITFTGVDALGKSTVDAAVKKGIAKAILPASTRATISAASGVAIGNEIHWAGDGR